VEVKNGQMMINMSQKKPKHKKEPRKKKNLNFLERGKKLKAL